MTSKVVIKAGQYWLGGPNIQGPAVCIRRIKDISVDNYISYTCIVPSLSTPYNLSRASFLGILEETKSELITPEKGKMLVDIWNREE